MTYLGRRFALSENSRGGVYCGEKGLLVDHVPLLERMQQLRASGLLKADWDPRKHPRWPAGSPGSVGGEFAPRSGVDASSVEGQSTPIIQAEMVIPAPELTIPRLFPPGWAVPRGVPWPSEITPAPLAPPDVNPITIPRNPYPQRPKCRREWQIATEDCLKLWTDGQLGRDYIRGAGDTVAQCIMGRVSQDCGGNRLDA
jgi:hypothetical protein